MVGDSRNRRLSGRTLPVGEDRGSYSENTPTRDLNHETWCRNPHQGLIMPYQAVQIAGRREMVRGQLNRQPQQQPQQQQQPVEVKLDKLDYKRQKREQPRHQSRQPPKDSANCSFCGGHHSKGKKYCPASNKVCSKCGRKNHFAKVCKSPEVQELVHDIQEDTLLLGHVDAERSPWIVHLKLCGKKVPFKIDTGADVTVISKDTYSKMSWKPALQPVKQNLTGPGGSVSCCGSFRTQVRFKNEFHQLHVYVVDGLDRNLLSREMAVQMKMVCRIDDVLPKDPAEEPLGTMVGEPVRIHLREDAQPYSVSSARRIALPLLPAVKREVQRMLDSDIIEPVTTPSDWCAPIVPVVKKGSEDGGEPKVRLCIDFKKLNHAIKPRRTSIWLRFAVSGCCFD
ncbi:uncharacterized protein K02A2.6-like [Amphibalanus amphitrite]|uniref:uncharacterized protein K02A2.6-like n=1 Tax=Amphibalanus amphitrite TaxID=1232801 RepID=UPI001C908D73|nr:uncharacterized protein K02A2.6-like [Amphibalanus amphitrite]